MIRAQMAQTMEKLFKVCYCKPRAKSSSAGGGITRTAVKPPVLLIR